LNINTKNPGCPQSSGVFHLHSPDYIKRKKTETTIQLYLKKDPGGNRDLHPKLINPIRQKPVLMIKIY
jgi:hypothetical protein